MLKGPPEVFFKVHFVPRSLTILYSIPLASLFTYWTQIITTLSLTLWKIKSLYDSHFIFYICQSINFLLELLEKSSFLLELFSKKFILLLNPSCHHTLKMLSTIQFVWYLFYNDLGELVVTTLNNIKALFTNNVLYTSDLLYIAP